jgi:hypothetical protein
LTLQEDPQSNLPLGPSCGGVAAQTLYCRAFLLTLKNIGPDAVHIEDERSYSVSMDRSRLGMTASGGSPGFHTKDALLRPGESIQRSVRGTHPDSPYEEIGLGPHAVHAEWILYGCTENPPGKECRYHLDDGSPFYPAQAPITVMSAEIMVDEPQLHDLGDVRPALQLTAHPAKIGNAAGDCRAETNPIDCTVFHLTTRNLGRYPIRYGVGFCSSYDYKGAIPQYRSATGRWQDLALLPSPVQCVGGCTCLSGFSAIFPGDKDQEFTLKTLGRGFDTSMLQSPGSYHLRFVLTVGGCIASPDATFCLADLDDPLETVSNDVEVNTTVSNR